MICSTHILFAKISVQLFQYYDILVFTSLYQYTLLCIPILLYYQVPFLDSGAKSCDLLGCNNVYSFIA